MKKHHILPLLLLVQLLFLQIVKRFPKAIDRFYVDGFYVYSAPVFKAVFGWLPFSFGDVVYLFIIIYGIWFLFNFKKHKKRLSYNPLWRVLSFISVLVICFYTFWGYHYFRTPLEEKLNLTHQVSSQDYLDFITTLIENTNVLHYEITKDSAAQVEVPLNLKAIYTEATTIYKNSNTEAFQLLKPVENCKSSLFSEPLSYMGFGGYFNPFTHEAQVNYNTPKYLVPFVTCHELAHQGGVASETECNFIAYKVALHSNNLYFKYAANCMAIRHCLYTISGFDFEKIEPLLNSLNKGIIKNFEQSEAYHEKYDGVVGLFFEKSYDGFLKMNEQKEGLQSYSRFIELLIQHEKLQRSNVSSH